MSHGVTCPAIVILIDNIANFREKTEGQYDDILAQLLRECASCGIYMVISAAGFNTTEITARMRDNIHQTICMEMVDRFAYGDCLNTMQLSVLPESGIHGRGLVIVNGEALEFQAALSVDAADDYKKNEAIQKECERLNQYWRGKRARSIPKVPEKPVWEMFATLEEVKTLVRDDRSLPIGYDLETADIFSVDLTRTYCYLISGKGRTGKTNCLKTVMYSAKLRNGHLVVVEFGSQELERSARAAGAEYINTYEEYMDFIKWFIPEFQKRNNIKKEALKAGLEEPEIYSRLHQEPEYYILIADLAAYTQMLHSPQGIKDNVCGAMANLFDKGFLHNIYFFACLNQDQRMELMSKEVYEKFVRYKMGLHLGGNITAQRLLDFNGMSFTEQSAVEKPGVAAVPPTDNEPYHRIILPLVKGRPVA